MDAGRMAARLAVLGPGTLAPAPARRRRPDVPDRRRRHGAGAASGRPRARRPWPSRRARRRRRARPRRGARAPTGSLDSVPGAARRRRRLDRLRAAAPGARGGLAPPPARAARPDRPGDGGAGPGDHRAEGDRPGGVRAGSGCWCTGTASARPARARERRLWVQPAAGDAARRSRRGSGCGCTSTRPGRAPSSPSPGSPTRWSGRSGCPYDEADRRLRSLPGVGVWTSAEVRQRALGDPDAVSFGDYHVAKDVGWALTGTPFDDAELAEFLEPWRPHRGRVAAARRDGRAAPPAARPADGAADPPAGELSQSEQRPQRPQDQLGEPPVQVARLPLAVGQLDAVGLVERQISSSAWARSSSITSTLIS